MMVFIVQSEKKCQVGYLRVRSISKRFRFLKPDHIIVSLPFCPLFFVVKESNFLTTFYFSDMLADKNQVAPRLSFTNIPTLNFLLRSKIFVSEDR